MSARNIPILAVVSLACLAPGTSAQDPRANDVVRTSTDEAELTDESLAMIRRHFEICDLDGNEWISFREASATLGIPKSEFRRYDVDDDGRFTESEFAREKQRMLQLLGALRPSVPERASSTSAGSEVSPGTGDRTGFLAGPGSTSGRATPSATAWEFDARVPEPSEDVLPTTLTLPGSVKSPFPDPAELIAFFDRDESNGLSREEVRRALRRVGARLSADVILDRTDRDATNQLELEELGPLAAMISRRWSDSGLPRTGREATVPRSGPVGEGSPASEERATPAPDDAPSGGHSPVPTFGHFGKLDADADGKIDARDLRMRLSPARASIRASSIISALDLDGDGSLDAAEFHSALARP